MENFNFIRIGFAADVLLNKFLQNNQFISWIKHDKQGPKVDLFHTLLAVSLIHSLAKFLERPYLIPKLDQLWKSIIDQSVQRENSTFVLTPQGSLTSWNSLIAHVLIKKHNYELAISFANGLVESVTDKVHRFIPGTGPSETISNEPGLIALTLLEIFDITHENIYLNTAKKIIPMFIKYQQLNPRNGWAIAALWERENWSDQPEWEQHINLLFNSIDIDSRVANGVVVPYMLQTALLKSITYKGLKKTIDSKITNRINDMLKLQSDLQIDTNHNYGYDTTEWEWMGAFVKEPSNPLIRIDYLLHSVFAYLQYFYFQVEQRKIQDIVHIY